ncbi:MAG: hypothetical protein HOM68_19725 [Gemmatimonadetes bacterium]|jgi:hypothetical protein|nr:hypothetical protein [Gemmatimonadota bacterium]MBT5589008.1 hypothetical protein [Gemmatimonadota bacterium]MBT7454018.1 hypothetical protein [Gemmatimonadota bacterium]
MAKIADYAERFAALEESKQQRLWEYLDEEISQVCESGNLLTCYMYDFEEDEPSLEDIDVGRQIGLQDHEKVRFYLGEAEATLVRQIVDNDSPDKLVLLYGVREVGDAEGTVRHDYITSFQVEAEDT